MVSDTLNMKPPLEERELLYASTRKQWREWLRKNHSAKKEIWLVYYKKHSNKIRIPYNDAVEEALCFGWIDSTVRTIDENKYAQRFSPRKAGSAYSQSNIERLRALIKRKKVIKSVLDKLPKLPSVQSKAPDDIIEAIERIRAAAREILPNILDIPTNARPTPSLSLVQGGRQHKSEKADRAAAGVK